MVDRELVLRFLAMHHELANYRTPLLRFLNDFMRTHQDPDDLWLDSSRHTFASTIGIVHEVLGSSAFRVMDKHGTPVERSVNRALFDAEMVAFSYSNLNHIAGREDAVKSSIAGLFGDERFEDSIRRATGDKARVRQRIARIADTLEDAGVEISQALRQALDSLEVHE